ncbi:MAG: sodium-dependent transporter [Victivallales bacterium]|nr:sodium-dependent transporter [Victivallales bacterium]
MAGGANERSLWGSRAGFLLAAIGSAVGLGNIWRFSYVAYSNGGGAFLLPYLVALLLAGAPIMLVEYGLGHKYHGSPPLAFRAISSKMEWAGWWMPIVATLGIMLFYAVVIGWCINFFLYSFNLGWGDNTQEFFFNNFLLIENEGTYMVKHVNWQILGATFIVWLTCWGICFKEVNHGIEKACLVFMPLLLILTTVLVVWSITLDGAAQGILLYIKPDWGKIDVFSNPEAWKVWTAAFGQTFFTLSLGFGIMITYASYLPKRSNLVGNGIFVCLADTMYSIFAGFAVFGVLGFMAASRNVSLQEVVKQGPGLAFVVYPQAINQLPVARELFGALFFFTLVLAGLSSGISLIEAFTCSITDKFGFKRGKVVSIICVAGFLGSIIFTTNIGLFVLDIVDHFINSYGLLAGGLLECVLVGWFIKTKLIRKHMNDAGGIVIMPAAWDWCVKIVTPAILLLMIVMAVVEDISKPYEGYPRWMILTFGVGALLLTLLPSVALSLAKWPDRKVSHKPEQEHILT